jgi:hypothetical protein
MIEIEPGDYVRIKANRNKGAFGIVRRYDTSQRDCCVLVELDETPSRNHQSEDWYDVTCIEPAVDTEYQEAVKLFGEEYFA